MVDELVEQQLGAVEVGPAERLQGIEFVPVSVGNPHAVVEGDPARSSGSDRCSRRSRAFQSERTSSWRVDGSRQITARIWSAAWGDKLVRHERCRCRRRPLRRGETEVSFPGGALRVRIERARPT